MYINVLVLYPFQTMVQLKRDFTFIYYTIHVALYYTACLINPLLYSVVPYKTTPTPDQPPPLTYRAMIKFQNLSNSEDNKALIARLVHEAEVTEEFNLDDSFQLDQINLDELLDTYRNHDMHIHLSTDDNQLNDTNNLEDINTHIQMNEEIMERKQQPNAINTNNNIDTQNLMMN